jgi:hypothetical protein
MVLSKSIDLLTEKMSSLGNSLTTAIQVADRFQKGTTALGLSYEGAVRQFGTSIDNLRGGVIDRLNNGLVTLAEGFQGSTKGIAKLINQQQLTNGAFRLTARRLASLEVTLGTTREQTGNLAETILKTSLQYTITTDKLVDVLSSLQQNAAALNVGGLQMLPETLTRLAGSFGPQLANDVKAFAQILGDPSLQNQMKLTAMGIGRIREDFAAAQTESQRLDILLKGIKTAGKQFQILGGDAEELFAGVSVPIQQLGKAGASLFVLSQNINKREIQNAKNRSLFGETIANMRREIFVPFKMAFMEVVYPLARDLIMGFTELIKPQIVKFRDFLVSFTDGLPQDTDQRLKFIASGVGSVIDEIVLAAAYVRNGFMEVYNHAVNFSRQLGSLVADIYEFRKNPTKSAGESIGRSILGAVAQAAAGTANFVEDATDGVFKATPKARAIGRMGQGLTSDRAPIPMVDINRGKVDIASLDQNKYTNLLLEQMEALAAERNAQLEGLPEAIADANKPTEIMEASFQTLGDVMATIAAQNTDDNPLMEELLRAAQVTADNTTVRASALPANNGG